VRGASLSAHWAEVAGWFEMLVSPRRQERPGVAAERASVPSSETMRMRLLVRQRGPEE
jgi:hypothetical protein